MTIELINIPGLEINGHAHWEVRLLQIEDRCEPLTALNDWADYRNADYKKIIKGMRMAAQVHRLPNEDLVRRSGHPDSPNAYEFRADKGLARLMFFYCEDDSYIIGTNSHVKGQGDQSQAFLRCEQLRNLYTTWKIQKSRAQKRR